MFLFLFSEVNFEKKKNISDRLVSSINHFQF